jgi:site-specific DNA recombinase
MRDSHLDAVVTELVLARLERPDFLAMLGERGKGTDDERQALLAEIAKYQEYLEKVRDEAAQNLRFDLLMDQEARIEPKINAAQKRLEKLSEMDPFVLRLVSEGSVRHTWDALALQNKRRVIRAVMTPRVNRVNADAKGRRGINNERVEAVWR